jgi:acetolactate synthase regulatory subunit
VQQLHELRQRDVLVLGQVLRQPEGLQQLVKRHVLAVCEARVLPAQLKRVLRRRDAAVVAQHGRHAAVCEPQQVRRVVDGRRPRQLLQQQRLLRRCWLAARRRRCEGLRCCRRCHNARGQRHQQRHRESGCCCRPCCVHGGLRRWGMRVRVCVLSVCVRVCASRELVPAGAWPKCARRPCTCLLRPLKHALGCCPQSQLQQPATRPDPPRD